MLHVKSVCRVHEPIAIGYVTKSFTRDKIPGISVENEWQRKERLGAVEEKNRSVALGDGIRLQSGEGRNLCSMRDRCADSVRAISPVVERALKRFAHDCAAPEDPAQGGTVRIHDGDLPARLSISNQLPAQ